MTVGELKDQISDIPNDMVVDVEGIDLGRAEAYEQDSFCFISTVVADIGKWHQMAPTGEKRLCISRSSNRFRALASRESKMKVD